MAEIRHRVARQLDDPDMIYWTPDELDHKINMAQRLWALITLCIERTVVFSLITDQTFSLISDQIDDFIVPLRASFNGIRLKTATIHQLDLGNQTWRKTSGSPTSYAQTGFDLFAIYPQPASGTNVIELVYAAQPREMVLDSDVPEIPPEQQIWLERGATYLALIKNGGIELKNGTQFWTEFLDAAAKYAGFTRSRSRAQRYDVEPFDLTSFDRSRWEIKIKNQQPTKRSVS